MFMFIVTRRSTVTSNRFRSQNHFPLFEMLRFFLSCSAMGDFHELKLGFRRVWSPVDSSSPSSVGYYGNGTMTGGAGSQSVAARSAARPIAYRPAGATGGGSTGTGLGTGLATGLSFSPGQSLGMSMSPPRTSMIHSSGYSTMSTPSRAVSSSVSLTAMAGATRGGENSASDGEQVGPGVRFCHVGVVYEGAFYIFGGYDGTQRYVLRLFGCRVFCVMFVLLVSVVSYRIV